MKNPSSRLLWFPLLMDNITILLAEMRGGSEVARTQLFERVYAELTHLARSRIARGQRSQLDAPSLVHEAYLRLVEHDLPSLKNRREFFAYSAAVMRNVMIDAVRRDNAEKRGAGATQLTLSSADAEIGANGPDLEALHSALEQLERIDARAFRIVEMRYFAGLSLDEIAEVLELSTMTVKRDWKSARAFLFKELRS